MAARIVQAIHHRPGGLVDLDRLMEHNQRIGRKIMQERRRIRRLRRGRIGRSRDARSGNLPRRTLGAELELPDRFDLVAEKLQPDGIGIRRGEDVQDAATQGEIAGLLDGVQPLEAPLDQPRSDLLRIVPVPHRQFQRMPVQTGGRRDRLRQCLNRRDDDRRRFLDFASQRLTESGTLAGDLAGTAPLARQRLPGGE